MKLNKKIILVTISILLVSLLISSAVNVVNFRKNYTEALITGSYGLGQSLNSVLSEMLNLGLPLESLSGMDKKLKQLVENNPHISYAGITDSTGKAIFHSDAGMVGRTLDDEVMRRSLATPVPLTQLYARQDGHQYYDVTIPVFDAERVHRGVIRMGFRTEVVNDKVNLAIGQVALNFVLTFAVIAFFVNFLLARLVSQPVIALSQQARRISQNDFDSEVLVGRRDEIGELSHALNLMSRTLRGQMAALQRSRSELEELVELRTRELALYFKFFNASSDLMGIADPGGTFRKINPAFVALLGYSEAEILARPFIEFVHPEDRQATRDEMARQQQLGFSTDFSNRYVCKDGSCRWLLWRATVNSEDGLTYATARDITDRIRAEEALRESEGRYRRLIENSPDVVYIYSSTRGALFYSSRVESLLGYPLAYLRDHPFLWGESIHPEDLPRVKQAIEDSASGQSFVVEYRLRDAQGNWRWVYDRSIERHITQGEVVIEGLAADITERKQVEETLRAKTEALLRSNADLDQFAYSVSHDMRQPLRMVTGHLQLLAKGLHEQLDEDNRENLKYALDGARRMDAMIVSLLEYSRVGRKTDMKEDIQSRPSLDEALAFLTPAIEEAHAAVSVAGEWPLIHASRDELTRLFQNLVGNAIHYHEPGAPPRVEVEACVSGEIWRVSVRDHGIGIDPQQIGRLFQFFSRLQSRERFAGTGMGLALSRRIVEHHGGRIWVESAGEGQGSAFIFELPLHRTAAEEASA